MQTAKRIDWIDIAKGIGILLVVLGHMNIPHNMSLFIFSFHMPLFFFISGYLFNEKKYTFDFKTIFISKFATLLWPFITFTFLALFIDSLYNLNSIRDFNYLGFLIGISSINVPLWFLTALFSTEIIFSQIVRFSRHKFKDILGLLIILSSIGFCNAYFWHLKFFYNIHIALIALSFFWVGWLFNKYGIYKYTQKILSLIIQFFISFIILSYISINYTELDMLSSTYGNISFVFISFFSGVILTISLAKIIKQVKYTKVLFSYFGKNSLIILATHSLYAPLIQSLIDYLPYRLDRIITIVLIFLSIEIINRKLPGMLMFHRLNLKEK